MTEQAQPQPPQPKKNNPAGIGCIIAIAAVVVIAIIAAVNSGGNDTPPTSDAGQPVSDQRLAAFDVCKQFVSDRLKAPGSAKWRDPFGDQVRYSGDGEGPITVTASVDSQNSFGALLRNGYTCTVTHAGGDSWHLDNLSLDSN